jgi:hypothetical protein
MLWQLLTAPVSGLLWVAEQIEERAQADLDRQQNLQRQLTQLQIQLDLGEISEADYLVQESAILEAMTAPETDV